MTERVHADVPAMTAVAGRLDEVTDEVHAATRLLGEGAGGDLGPEVTAAVDALADEWTARLAAVQADTATGAADVRAVRDNYLDVDATVAAELRHGK